MTKYDRLRYILLIVVTVLTCEVLSRANEAGGAATAPSPNSTTRPVAASRPDKRPVLSDDEYNKLADDLRQAYRNPADQWPAPGVDDAARPTFKEIGLLPSVEFPADNAYSKDKAD